MVTTAKERRIARHNRTMEQLAEIRRMRADVQHVINAAKDAMDEAEEVNAEIVLAHDRRESVEVVVELIRKRDAHLARASELLNPKLPKYRCSETGVSLMLPPRAPGDVLAEV